MSIPCFTPPYFETTTPEWKQYLDLNGYVVLQNILEQPAIDTAYDLFWKDWNSVSPGFLRDDPSSWSIHTAPMMFAKGIAVFNGFGQSDFMWHLRLQPKILDIFSQVHNTPHADLISSFDGFSVFFTKKQKNPKAWWHIDQHPSNINYSIQGAYNFLPVTEETAGLTVVPQSHTTFVPSETRSIEDWIPLERNKTPEEARPILANGVKLLLPANSFVLWNSRTIHANIGQQRDTQRLTRLTAYITYVPRSRTTPEITAQRRQAYVDAVSTSHWPDKLEPKAYPWGFGPRYEARGFGKIKPRLNVDGSIPTDRLVHI